MLSFRSKDVIRRRHLGLVLTPVKKRRRSVLRDAKSENVLVMSDCHEVPASEVSPETPAGKENEVIAAVTVPDEDMLRQLLMRIEQLEQKVKTQQESLSMHEEFIRLHEGSLTAGRAVTIRFFLDYVYDMYKEAVMRSTGTKMHDFLTTLANSGHGKSFRLTVQHTIKGFPDENDIDKDLASKILLFMPLQGKLSGEECHSSSLRSIACSLLSETAVALLGEDNVVALKEVFYHVFGASVEEIAKSKERLHSLAFPPLKYAKSQVWKGKVPVSAD